MNITKTNDLSSRELLARESRSTLPTRPSIVRIVDFHGLSRSMQERFASCARGSLAPKPLAVATVRSRAGLLFGAAVAFGVGLLIAVVAFGFGDLGQRQAMHDTSALPVYVVAVSSLTLGAVQLLVRRLQRKALPWQRAHYVFPLTLIDARDELLRVISLGDVQSAERDPHARRDVRVVIVNGEVLTLPCRDEAHAVATLRAIESGRDEARAARDSDERITLMFTLDPLQRPRLSSPLGPRGDLAQRLPPWTTRAWIVAPIAGLLLAQPARAARNAASDRALFSAANERGDTASFESYLALGGKRSEEVRTVLLPRAELRLAEKEGTVEAIDRFRTTHPDQIPQEVDVARRTAMLDELDRAKKRGTVAALQDFARRRPDHGLENELSDAMHAMFAPALDAYRQKPMPSQEVRSFVERLFAWSEAKAHAGSTSTTIQIRFHKRLSPSMRRADKHVAEHHWFIGEASYPSRYFDATHAEKRERAHGEVLARRVADAFGPTVFTVVLGPRLEDAQDKLPEVTEPTLFVTHVEDWKGTFDGSITKPRGVWVGLTHRFEAVFVIPGDDQPLRFELESAEPIPANVIKDHPEGGTPSQPLEEKIYGTMADGAFKKFSERFCAAFLPSTTG
ncbi:MAG: hypothetical protein HYV09_32015 [Deltaproteobacteria bacterium]|nr:hypothetical protein [Deltaproteobacteria bacterium]